ncbi:MAG: GPW/gp25 family protein [Thermodesulfobacteriota bacterium]
MSQPRGTTILSFPLLGELTPDGRLAWSTGEQSVREVLLHILLTRPGERLLRPEFGAGLRDFVHRPNTEATRALLADSVRRAVTRWEPRVILEDVFALPDPTRPAVVHLSIRYRLRVSGEPERFDLTLELTGGS